MVNTPEENTALHKLANADLMPHEVRLRCRSGRCRFGERIGDPGHFNDRNNPERWLRLPRKHAAKHANTKGHVVEILDHNHHIEYVESDTAELGTLLEPDEDEPCPF